VDHLLSTDIGSLAREPSQQEQPAGVLVAPMSSS